MAQPLTVITPYKSEEYEIETPDVRALVIGQQTQSDEFLVRKLRRSMWVDVAPDPVIPHALDVGNAYDVIVLHRPLDGSDGSIAICRQVRRGGVIAPIVLLATEGSTDDLVVALDAGADEFIVEPVNATLFSAQIRALQRRARFRVTPATTAQHHMPRGPPEQ